MTQTHTVRRALASLTAPSRILSMELRPIRILSSLLMPAALLSFLGCTRSNELTTLFVPRHDAPVGNCAAPPSTPGLNTTDYLGPNWDGSNSHLRVELTSWSSAMEDSCPSLSEAVEAAYRRARDDGGEVAGTAEAGSHDEDGRPNSPSTSQAERSIIIERSIALFRTSEAYSCRREWLSTAACDLGNFTSDPQWVSEHVSFLPSSESTAVHPTAQFTRPDLALLDEASCTSLVGVAPPLSERTGLVVIRWHTQPIDFEPPRSFDWGRTTINRAMEELVGRAHRRGALGPDRQGAFAVAIRGGFGNDQIWRRSWGPLAEAWVPEVDADVAIESPPWWRPGEDARSLAEQIRNSSPWSAGISRLTFDTGNLSNAAAVASAGCYMQGARAAVERRVRAIEAFRQERRALFDSILEWVHAPSQPCGRLPAIPPNPTIDVVESVERSLRECITSFERVIPPSFSTIDFSPALGGAPVVAPRQDSDVTEWGHRIAEERNHYRRVLGQVQSFLRSARAEREAERELEQTRRREALEADAERASRARRDAAARAQDECMTNCIRRADAATCQRVCASAR